MDTPSGSPIIYQSSPTFSSNVLKETWKDKFKKHLPKIIFAVLALFLVAELIYGIQTLTRPFPTKVDATSTIGVGKIVLDAPKSNFATGEQIPVKVRVVTAGRATDSTDLLLKYDPKMLDATSSGIINGTLYKEYIINEVDQVKGEVRISAITPPNTEGFVGVGEFATVNFLAKQDGNTKVEVDFVKGSTTDSNLVETGIAIDILDQVYNLDLNIGFGETVASPALESCGGYYQYCHNLVGQTGRQFCKQGRKIENMCTFDPKLTTECDICRLGF
jgi:hypothetical protein